MHKAVVNEPLSFHVTFLLGKEFALPEGKSSVDVLRMPLLASSGITSTAETPESPRRLVRMNSQLTGVKVQNLTGTRLELWTKKFKSSLAPNEDIESAWQERLVIVTDKRIFIITRKQDVVQSTGHTAKSLEFEIVDSIPMEEIISIELDCEPGMSELDAPPTPPRAPSFLSLKLMQAATFLLNSRPAEEDAATAAASGDTPRTEPRRAPSGGSRGSRRPPASEDYCEPILRIATEPGGFNHGQSYYFLLRKQARRSAPSPRRALRKAILDPN